MIELIRTQAEKRIRAAAAFDQRTVSIVERLVLEWQWGFGNEFRTKLWAAIEAADENELHHLERGYPAEVLAVRVFRTTWIEQTLKDKGLL